MEDFNSLSFNAHGVNSHNSSRFVGHLLFIPFAISNFATWSKALQCFARETELR